MASVNIPPTFSLMPGAFRPTGFHWLEHFETGGSGTTVGGKFATTADAAQWLATADNGGSNVILDGEPKGVLRITPGTSAADFRSLQVNGEMVAIGTNRDIHFYTRIRTNDADDIKFVVGLASTDVTGSTAGPVLDGTNDMVAFRNAAGNALAFQAVVEDDTTETTAEAGVLANDTWIHLRISIYGRNRVEFWVNEDLVSTIRTNIPDDGAALTPTLEVGSPTGTTATYLDVDYVEIFMSE